MDCYKLLSKRCRLQLEHPFMSNLAMAVIDEGNFAEAERQITQAAREGMLQEYIRGT